MSTPKDVQDLLRLLTTGRNKLPMLQAMGRVKALQEANLRSIGAVASADLETLTTAINDAKAAKSLQTACKSQVKDPSKKRPSDASSLPTPKRAKSAYQLFSEPQSPSELEASLALPQPSVDEEAISKCIIYTNRAPLVLAFAVQLLAHTMPEQPLSSRLSLAQAVVSANSRSKAQSLGIEKGKSAEEVGWGQGQPKVKVMGRDVHVLKRTGYEWKDGEDKVKEEPAEVPEVKPAGESVKGDISTSQEQGSSTPRVTKEWTISASVTLKKSTFVARSITVTSPSQAKAELQKLLASIPDLQDASHNISAWRVPGDHGILEDSSDDGESGGGRHILGVLQSSNLTGVLLVVTRWYGGVFLGPDRWRIMSEVSRDALSQRLRVTGTIGQEALWGLDLEAMRSNETPVAGPGMPIYKPESARAYVLKAFASPDDSGGKKKTGAALNKEKEVNLGFLLGALDLLFESWKGLGRDELDRRAWGWYINVRPEVASGVAGWGGKGEVRLGDILNLRKQT